MAQWRCRVCGVTKYHRVAVLNKNGQRYETAFYACSGCSVMFLNDTTFNDLQPVLRVQEARTPRTPQNCWLWTSE